MLVCFNFSDLRYMFRIFFLVCYIGVYYEKSGVIEKNNFYIKENSRLVEELEKQIEIQKGYSMYLNPNKKKEFDFIYTCNSLMYNHVKDPVYICSQLSMVIPKMINFIYPFLSWASFIIIIIMIIIVIIIFACAIEMILSSIDKTKKDEISDKNKQKICADLDELKRKIPDSKKMNISKSKKSKKKF